MDDAPVGQLLIGYGLFCSGVLCGRTDSLSNSVQKPGKEATMIRARDREPVAPALECPMISGHFGRMPMAANGSP
jgi:hypothetical protein